MMGFLRALFGFGRRRSLRRREWNPTDEMETEMIPAIQGKSMEELIEFWRESSPRGRATTRKLQQTDGIRMRDMQF